MENFKLGSAQISRNEIIRVVARVTIASVITFYSVKWMMNFIDPTSKSKRKAKLHAEELLKRLGKHGFYANVQNFNEYELIIASHLVVPSDIPISWEDIAGLDSIIQELKESVVLPIRHNNIFSQSKLWRAPKGVLLYGPPGCGKTLIAKATAKEAGMRFINLDVAILTDKWYGESQKLASAVFSLASKIQPCIIFIDEIDSFLRSRNSNDHEATAMMKTQFMMLWDGLSTNPNSTVVVMGATNRPQDLDKAIIRRMPAQFHIGLPNTAQRAQILKLILETEQIDPNINFEQLAEQTNGFSGSDLKEMCRNATVLQMRKVMLSNDLAQVMRDKSTSANMGNVLSITMEDLLKSYDKIKKGKLHIDGLFINNRIELD